MALTRLDFLTIMLSKCEYLQFRFRVIEPDELERVELIWLHNEAQASLWSDAFVMQFTMMKDDFLHSEFAAQSTSNMTENMSLSQLPLTLIVAATRANGIGNAGGLPWPMLKKEMAYFARVTKRVPGITGTGSLQSDTLKQTIMDGQRRNAVIMGRKTWESIPPKMRPLKDRTNIIISTQGRDKLGNLPEDVIVASSIPSAFQSLEKLVQDNKTLPVSRAFIIGGSTIYRAALDLPQTNRILLTRIAKDFECDTFFPIDLIESTKWKQRSRQELEQYIQEALPEEIMSDKQGEEEVQFEFQLFEKV